MTTTNRFANRLVLALAGLLMVALGGVVVAAAIPATGPTVVGVVGDLRAALQDLVTTAGSTTVHGVAAAVAVVGALLCLVLVVSRGGGRTSTAHADTSGAADGLAGGVELSTSFVQDVLADALEGRPEIAGVTVSAWRRRRSTVWRIRVRPAPGASPRTVVDLVAEQVGLLDDGLGTPVPVLLEVVG